MIVCEPKYLEDRCRERGYSIEAVMPCVTKQEGGLWWIDETHSSYPHPKNPCLAGTELKAMLSWLGVNSDKGCKCNDRAAIMDNEGCQWVKDNVEEVVGWLEEEAKQRGLPFFRTAGKYLVLRAVRQAETKAHVSPTE
jgi:hypothetical protein